MFAKFVDFALKVMTVMLFAVALILGLVVLSLLLDIFLTVFL